MVPRIGAFLRISEKEKTNAPTFFSDPLQFKGGAKIFQIGFNGKIPKRPDISLC